MKRKGKLLTLTLLCAIIVGVAEIGQTSPQRVNILPQMGSGYPFRLRLELTEHPNSAGPVDMRFSYKPLLHGSGGDMFATVTTENGLQYYGEETWAFQADTGNPYSTIIHISIPPNDTSSISVKVHRGGNGTSVTVYFVTTGDSVEVWDRNPRSYRPRPKPPESHEIKRDTLSQEQLQTEYDVVLDLHDSIHLKAAERILGPLPDSAVYDRQRGYYRLGITLEKLFKLDEEGIELDRIRDGESKPSDGLPERQQGTDSLKQQGALDSKPGTKGNGSISLEYVEGLTTSGALSTNRDITFYLRIDNNTGYDIAGMTNGFRVYSPDHLTH